MEDEESIGCCCRGSAPTEVSSPEVPRGAPKKTPGGNAPRCPEGCEEPLDVLKSVELVFPSPACPSEPVPVFGLRACLPQRAKRELSAGELGTNTVHVQRSAAVLS